MKEIDGSVYWIFRDGKYWYVRRGPFRGWGYVGEWFKLSDAKRAAHRHAEGTP